MIRYCGRKEFMCGCGKLLQIEALDFRLSSLSAFPSGYFKTECPSGDGVAVHEAYTQEQVDRIRQNAPSEEFIRFEIPDQVPA